MTAPPLPADPGAFELGRCRHCGTWTSSPQAWGCRQCGAAGALVPTPPPGDATLLEFITLHTPLVAGLAVPCVIGEVQLAPGLVEEALIAAGGEDALAPGLRLRPEPAPASAGVAWWFRPTGDAA